MTNQYPTPSEIQEFLKAHKEGGEEAIANLLREKQKAPHQVTNSKRKLGKLVGSTVTPRMEGPIGYEVVPKEK